MSASDYVRENDLMGAYGKYQMANARWKNHWWETVEKIYNSGREWAKQYILDPINRTLTKISKAVKEHLKNNVYIEDETQGVKGCGAYLVFHYLEGKCLWAKVGKADNGKKRLKEHFKKDYKGNIDKAVVKLWYPCDNSDIALTMENIMRDYFHHKKNFEWKKQDRFPGLDEITEEDVNYLNGKYELLKQLFA